MYSVILDMYSVCTCVHDVGMGSIRRLFQRISCSHTYRSTTMYGVYPGSVDLSMISSLLFDVFTIFIIVQSW